MGYEQLKKCREGRKAPPYYTFIFDDGAGL